MVEFAAAILIFAAAALFPQYGECAEIRRQTEDGTEIIVSTESPAVETPAEAEKAAPEPAQKYDKSIHSALKKMNLTPSHLDLWASEHKRTTLTNLSGLPAEKQRKVAHIATFIRKTNRQISPKVAWREASAIVYYSMKYKVPSELIVSLAKLESRFNPTANSSHGACGVMQVLWSVHHGMLQAKGIAPTKQHMFDPERGIEAGILIFSRYVKAYGTIQKAVNRYYGGISTVYLKRVNKNVSMLKDHAAKTGY